MIKLVKCGEGDMDKIEGLERRIFKPSEQYTLSFISWLCRSCSRSHSLHMMGINPLATLFPALMPPGRGTSWRWDSLRIIGGGG